MASQPNQTPTSSSDAPPPQHPAPAPAVPLQDRPPARSRSQLQPQPQPPASQIPSLLYQATNQYAPSGAMDVHPGQGEFSSSMSSNVNQMKPSKSLFYWLKNVAPGQPRGFHRKELRLNSNLDRVNGRKPHLNEKEKVQYTFECNMVRVYNDGRNMRQRKRNTTGDFVKDSTNSDNISIKFLSEHCWGIAKNTIVRLEKEKAKMAEDIYGRSAGLGTSFLIVNAIDPMVNFKLQPMNVGQAQSENPSSMVPSAVGQSAAYANRPLPFASAVAGGGIASPQMLAGSHQKPQHMQHQQQQGITSVNTNPQQVSLTNNGGQMSINSAHNYSNQQQRYASSQFQHSMNEPGGMQSQLQQYASYAAMHDNVGDPRFLPSNHPRRFAPSGIRDQTNNAHFTTNTQHLSNVAHDSLGNRELPTVPINTMPGHTGEFGPGPIPGPTEPDPNQMASKPSSDAPKHYMEYKGDQSDANVQDDPSGIQPSSNKAPYNETAI